VVAAGVVVVVVVVAGTVVAAVVFVAAASCADAVNGSAARTSVAIRRCFIVYPWVN
jgi:hypothetical protein